MSGEEFLRPRLVGRRFDDHAVPFEVLKDLALLEEMVGEVAKGKFLEAHPDRQRTPRGFTENVELKLVQVDDGSVALTIALVVAATHLPGMAPQLPYYEAARDAIVGAVAAAEQNQSPTAHLSDRALGYFGRLGRSLLEGEAIEFTTPVQTTPARLTTETRKRLVRASSQATEITQETTVRGGVAELDQDNRTFEIQPIVGRKIQAPLPEPFLDALFDALRGYRHGVRVAVQGVGRFDLQDHLKGLDSVEHVSFLEPLDVPARLDELRKLTDGWYEGQGVAPAAAGLAWLAQVFQRNFPDPLPLPHLYPTLEGGIQAEWSFEPDEVTLEVDLHSHEAVWTRADLAADRSDERTLDLDAAADWAWLTDELTRLGGGDG